MCIEKCNFCKSSVDIKCEKPHIPGEAKARIAIDREMRQVAIIEPIEKCLKRSKVLEQIEELRKTTVLVS